MEIRIDQPACGDVRACRLCLDRCPAKVFGTYPRGRRTPGTRATGWVVVPVFPSQCTGCRECVTFCPRHAISLTGA